jgi:hypothetical protein
MSKQMGRPRIYPAVTCERCGKQVGATSYARHLQKCEGEKP